MMLSPGEPCTGFAFHQAQTLQSLYKAGLSALTGDQPAEGFMPTHRFNGLAIVLAAVLLAFSSPARAELNVMISGGFALAYRELLPEFERTTGIKVVTGSGASQGTGPQTIKAQLERGTRADVVILSGEGLE